MTQQYPPGAHIIGTDPPQPTETLGYRLNHLMLRIKNPEKSLHFYKEGFGLRTVFTFNTGLWTIYYLGHPDTAEETGAEMLATLGTRKGLLELYHVPHDLQPSYQTGNAPGHLGFGHLGFTVPDVKTAVRRLLEVCPDTEVLKPLEEAEFKGMGVPKLEGVDADSAVEENYKKVFKQLCFVKDPDGYWVELVPQVVR